MIIAKQNSKDHVVNPINMTSRSKVDVELRSCVYATHHVIVTDTCAKYGKPMSNQKKKNMGRVREHVKNYLNLTLRPKVNVISIEIQDH